MLLNTLENLKPNELIYIGGTDYLVKQVVGTTAYVTRGRKTFLVEPEGSLFTVSPIVGDRRLPWVACNAVHWFEEIDLFPGLDDE